MKAMKINELGALEPLELTIQEDDGSGSFIQHISYGGLRGQ